MNHKNRVKIYQSRLHLSITLFFIVIPFLFFLFLSHFTNITTSTLIKDMGGSFLRISVAYFIAAVLGWTLAVFFSKGKRAIVALPVFDVLQSFPTFAALPLAVLLWGPSNETVIFFLVLTILWPILFSIISSMKLIKRDWEEAVSITRLSGWQYLYKFLWPVSVPGLITGSIIGLGEGWEALVATEIIVGIKTGLGSFFQLFSSHPSVTAFGILGLLILIFSMNKLIWLPLLEWSHREMEE